MQQSNPRFSIVVPIYNVEAYLVECIESILEQSFQNFELILVDEGSPDHCPVICDRYAAKDPRIQVIHKKNGGLVSARKAGTRQSRGQYILHVDGDDRIEEGMLRRIDAVIRQFNEPDMVSFGYNRITETGERIDSLHERLSEGEYSTKKGNMDEILNALLRTDRKLGGERPVGLCNSLCLKAIRREVAASKQESVPDGIRNGEDAAVVVPAAYCSSSIVVMHDALYNYRIRTNSMVRSLQADQMERLTEFIAYMRDAAPMLPEKNLISFAYREIEKYLIQAARCCTSYAEFRRAAEKSAEPQSKGSIVEYEAPAGTKAAHRFRIWFTKRGWLWMYWLIYHKKGK